MKKRTYGVKTFHYLPAWIGIVAIMLQLNAVPLDYLLFRINQEHIVQTLCEHKMPKCNGHCFLAKQIAKSGSADTDKRTEHGSVQLDGQFLCSEENNVTLFPTVLHSDAIRMQSIAAGWHSTLLQPPRYA